jgi:hypothetical protein
VRNSVEAARTHLALLLKDNSGSRVSERS